MELKSQSALFALLHFNSLRTEHFVTQIANKGVKANLLCACFWGSENHMNS